MGHLFDSVKDTQAQAQKVLDEHKEPGTAHDEWLLARGIDPLEFHSLEAFLNTGQLPPAQILRGVYEAGFKAGSKDIL